MLSINQRLQSVSQHIIGDTIADIGSDHAYLPIYAIQHKLCKKALAGEVIQGPYEAARKNVNDYELSEQIDVRLGNGLSIIKEDKVDTITICGMGGPLIAKILNEGKRKLTYFPRLILQSNIQTETLRKTIVHLNYQIIDETILEEKGHIYELLVAEKAKEPIQYTEKDMKFGPKLLIEKNNSFYKKWTRELKALETIKNQLNPHTHEERWKAINDEINLIKEVISE